MKILNFEIVSSKELKSIREVLSLQSREIENLKYTTLGQAVNTSQDLARVGFTEMVSRSRKAYIINPLIAQAVHLTTYYTFGEGISIPKATADSLDVQDIINKFWLDQDNKLSFTSSDAQLKLSNKLQYDGEMAFVLQVDIDGSVYVRLIDPTSIVDIITDKNDPMRNLFYKRTLSMNEQFIPDVDNGIAYLRENNVDVWNEFLKKYNIQDDQVPKNTFLYHVKINCDILDKRGVPETFRCLDWANANKKIAEDMASFINAQSQIAVKKTVQGTKSQIDSLKNRIKQNTDLTNPSYQAGSTLIQNKLIDTENISIPSSSATVFETGIRRTLLMISAGYGIMEHYFGDPGTGNLATASAMELPMLKKFLAKQKLWESIYARVLNFVLDMSLFSTTKAFEYIENRNRLIIQSNKDYKNRNIDIDFPPILEKELKPFIEAITLAKNNQLIPIETAQRLTLVTFKVNNIDEEMKKEYAEEKPSFQFPIQPTPTKESFIKELKEFVPPESGDAPQEVKDILSSSYSSCRADQEQSGHTDKDKCAKISWGAVHNAGWRKNPKGEWIKESASPPDFKTRRKDAVRLADKNKEILTQLNSYLKEIGSHFKKMQESVKMNVTTRKVGNKYQPQLHSLNNILESFIASMKKSARKHFPIAIDLAEKYVASHLLENKIKEKNTNKKILDSQLTWNEQFLDESLAPAMKKKIKALFDDEFLDETKAKSAIIDGIDSFSTRVASYAGALWTVEERSVKLFSEDEKAKVNFVGVDDDKTCEGCQRALEGNPYSASEAPIPGELDCLTQCRHALQIVGDEQLTESDINLLKQAEAEAKKGLLEVVT